MSVTQSSRAWALKLPPAQKLVLLALADAANHDGVAAASYALLVKRTGLSRRAVITNRNHLGAAGLVSWTPVRDGGPLLYRLWLSPLPPPPPPPSQLGPFGQPTNLATTQRMHLLAERDGWACAYCRIPLVPCGAEADYCCTDEAGRFLQPATMRWPTIDHVVPRSLGGGNGLDNLVLACSGCNTAKGARLP